MIEMNDFRDIEDFLQYQYTKNTEASYIITCNVKDDQTIHDIFVITPKQAVQSARPVLTNKIHIERITVASDPFLAFA